MMATGEQRRQAISRPARLAATTICAAILVAGLAPTALAADEPAADHPVGVLTRTFEDRSRPTPASGGEPKHKGRTLETTIWYPATAGPIANGTAVPDVAGGPYPLILFAHGLSATPATYEDLLTRIAAAGYVVVAPKFPLSSGGGPLEPDAGDVGNQPGDLSFLIDEMLDATRASEGLLAGLIDEKAIGVAGHSNGGITVLGATAHSCCRDKRIKAVAVLSGAPAPYPGGKYTFANMPPLLIVHGTADSLVPLDGMKRTFNKARGPKVLLTVEGGDHGSSASVDGPAGASVLATITDFFAGYLRGDDAAIARLPNDAEPDVTSILAATDPGSTEKVAIAPTVHYDRKVTVTPNKNLQGGDVVTVRWSGFSPGGVINILQCGPDRSSGAAGCDLTTGVILHADPTGEGELQITIIEGAVGDSICDAKHPPCVIIGNDDSSVDPASVVQVPIRFKK